MQQTISTDRPPLLATVDPRIRLRTIGIRKLSLDYSPAQGLNEEAVAQYTAQFVAGRPVEQVRVYFDGEAYYLAQGFHRVAAAKRAGRRMILADVHRGTRGDVEAELGISRSISSVQRAG